MKLALFFSILLCFSVYAFEADSAGIHVRIIHHRFDHATSDTCYTVCNVIRNRPGIVWLCYYMPGTTKIGREEFYHIPEYQISKVLEVCPW